MPPVRILWLAPPLVVLLTAQLAGSLLAGRAGQDPRPPAPAEVLPPPDPNDPALLRYRLVQRLNAQRAVEDTHSRLQTRLALDEIYPIPYLGVDTTPVADGLTVTAVYADTAAERAGLRLGDTLLSLAGAPLPSKALLARAVRSHRVGERVELALRRNGAPLRLALELGARPEEDEDFEEQFPDLFTAPPPPSQPARFDFAAGPAGALPPAFESFLGGHGRPGRWVIVEESGARFLRQEDADRTGIRFPMAIVRDWDAADAVARVRFRYSSGLVDRAAGLVLRFQDAGNYLVARINSGEADLRIFRSASGERRTLPGAQTAAPTGDGAWHTLEFRAEGPKLTATLDGKIQVVGYDSWFLRGRPGLWTKSDSVTEFDDFEVEALR